MHVTPPIYNDRLGAQPTLKALLEEAFLLGEKKV